MRRVFAAVRDEIRYHPYAASSNPESMRCCTRSPATRLVRIGVVGQEDGAHPQFECGQLQFAPCTRGVA
jgi:hypothetical protein